MKYEIITGDNAGFDSERIKSKTLEFATADDLKTFLTNAIKTWDGANEVKIKDNFDERAEAGFGVVSFSEDVDMLFIREDVVNSPEVKKLESDFFDSFDLELLDEPAITSPEFQDNYVVTSWY